MHIKSMQLYQMNCTLNLKTFINDLEIFGMGMEL